MSLGQWDNIEVQLLHVAGYVLVNDQFQLVIMLLSSYFLSS